MGNSKTSFTQGEWTVHHFVDGRVTKTVEAGVYEIEEANEEINGLLTDGNFAAAEEMAEANKRLIAAAPKMLLALQAQEVASAFSREGNSPAAGDPRYVPFIGKWNGYDAPEVRYLDFHAARQELRREALELASAK